MKYIYHYDIAAFFITTLILFNFLMKKRIITPVFKTFLLFTSTLLVIIITDIITIFSSAYDFIPPWLNTCFNIIYLFFSNALPPLFFFEFFAFTIEADKTLPLKKILLILIPFFLSTCCLFTIPFSNIILTFDNRGCYHAGKYFDIFYLTGLLYLIGTIIFSIINYKKLTRLQFVSVLFYSLTSISSIFIQLLFPSVLITSFFGSIAIFIIYISLDNPSDYIDSITEIYNKKAFLLIANRKIANGNSFNIVGIHIEDITFLNETFGFKNLNILIKNISLFLVRNTSSKYCFRISGSKFAILIDDLQKTDEIINYIQNRFNKPFVINSTDVIINYKMTVLNCPNESKNSENALDLLFDTLNSSNTKIGKFTPVNKTMMEKSFREKTLIKLMKEALLNNEFTVYYQPILSVEKQKITTAEALIRLPNKELGYVSPEEFIPIAEKNGLILEIGELVFKSVCEFIIKNKIWEKGIEFIHVNLSVIQCMQEKLYDQLSKIMQFYGLAPQYIHLEVTETAAVVSSDILLNNMNKFIENNIYFALDDYGTGFSNTSAILKYPFHSVKLDKSIVWAAIQDEKAKKLLHHTILMFKDMGINIIAEGIETEQMKEMLTQMGCDYIQGFFYSKPISEEHFIKFINQSSKNH